MLTIVARYHSSRYCYKIKNFILTLDETQYASLMTGLRSFHHSAYTLAHTVIEHNLKGGLMGSIHGSDCYIPLDNTRELRVLNCRELTVLMRSS